MYKYQLKYFSYFLHNRVLKKTKHVNFSIEETLFLTKCLCTGISMWFGDNKLGSVVLNLLLIKLLKLSTIVI